MYRGREILEAEEKQGQQMDEWNNRGQKEETEMRKQLYSAAHWGINVNKMR